MQVGFWIAIIGIIIVLIATIFYYSTGFNAYVRLATGTAAEKATPVGNVTVPTSSLAVIGWIVGGISIIAGGIWGIIAGLQSKKDVTIGNLLPMFLTNKSASSPTTPEGFTPAQIAQLSELIKQK